MWLKPQILTKSHLDLPEVQRFVNINARLRWVITQREKDGFLENRVTKGRARCHHTKVEKGSCGGHCGTLFAPPKILCHLFPSRRFITIDITKPLDI
jgi:hypothetical protein